MRWFRVYTEILNKPKVVNLPDDLFATWIRLLCVARLENDGGRLPPKEDLAIYLRLTLSRVTSRVTKLKEFGFVDEIDGVFIMHDWKTHQYESDMDPTAAERKRRQRERQNGNNGVKSLNVTRDVTGVSHPSDTDTDTEAEKEKKPPAPPSPISLSNDGCSRIEKHRARWNELKAGPPCRYLAISFKPDDRGDCLRTLGAYTDAEIDAALEAYAKISTSKEHKIFAPYGSFVGFMRGGVEKFVPDARPFEAFRKDPSPEDVAARPMATKKLETVPEPGKCGYCGGTIKADLIEGKGCCKDCTRWWKYTGESWIEDEDD